MERGSSHEQDSYRYDLITRTLNLVVLHLGGVKAALSAADRIGISLLSGRQSGPTAGETPKDYISFHLVSGLDRVVGQSKAEPQAELHAAWAHQHTGDLAEVGAGEAQVCGPVLGVVPGIEHLPPELNIHALVYAGVLNDPHIPVVDARLLDGTAGGVPFNMRCGRLQRVRIQTSIGKRPGACDLSVNVGPRRGKSPKIHQVNSKARWLILPLRRS